ncbi:PTS transporter subunit IIC, partial [Paenarthrobacter ureafaciens]|uniref:PTS transporter subunit IIC n=1 Tax=Paenarthrobacter ureafaciens TaxID=37931 RepID=UPI00397C9F40
MVIGGGLKAAVGFLILGAGATVVVGSLKPLGELILAVTGAQGVIPTNEACWWPWAAWGSCWPASLWAVPR